MIQTIIAITGLAAIWLASHKNAKHQQYACLFGLSGQPFWIFSAYNTQQWGILLLALSYTFIWGLAFKRHWL